MYCLTSDVLGLVQSRAVAEQDILLGLVLKSEIVLRLLMERIFLSEA